MKCPTCGQGDGDNEFGCAAMLLALAVLIVSVGSCLNGHFPYCPPSAPTVVK